MVDATEGVPVKAKGVRWDLSRIFPGAEAARSAAQGLLKDAIGFRERRRGTLGSVGPEELAQALSELGGLIDRMRALASYSELRSSTDSRSPENQDLHDALDQVDVEFDNATRFFRLEWQALPRERASALSAAPEVASVRHYLERLTSRAPHVLPDEVEAALAERSSSAVSGWQQLFSETTAAITAEFSPDGGDPTPHTIDELIAYRLDPRAQTRRGAVDALYRALEPWTPVLARSYDALVGDRLAMDRLHRFVDGGEPPMPLPMCQANLANDLEDQVVLAMMDAIEAHHGVAHRYFAIKAAQLGWATLPYYDLLAPLGPSRSCPYPEGRELVLEALERFSPEVRGMLQEFFTLDLIDAEPRPGKRGGAFCDSVATDRPAYVSLNYTDTLNDALVLAHELGHGLHAVLAKRAQPPLVVEPGLGMAEVASTFDELVFFDHVMELEQDPATRRQLVASRVERSCNTLFNQTAMARYEQRAYAAKARGESLNPERLGQFWLEAASAYFGEGVELPERFSMGWSYIPHFIATRFYTYSYSFAHLTSLALYARYLEDKAGFVPRYLELLSAGGSRPPRELLMALGIDIGSARWVEPAFALLDSWVSRASEEVGARATG